MASAGGGNAAFGVSMIPEDYKRLSPEVIAKIKPLTDDPETSDTGQLAARRYLADMGISLKTAIDARIGCLVHRCFGGKDSKDGKDKKNAAGGDGGSPDGSGGGEDGDNNGEAPDPAE